MREELYIDGQSMDLGSDSKGVQMVFQSPYLTELRSIVSNRTNTITLPPTPHNKAVIECMTLQQKSDFAYRRHSAIYKRDGIQMCAGTATLLSVDRNIQICLTWGNVDAFQKLFDLKLSDLRSFTAGGVTYSEQYIPYRTPDSTMQRYFAMPVQCGLNRRQPALRVQDILARIEARCGVSGLTSRAEWKPLGVMMTTNKGDATTRLAQAFSSQINTVTLRTSAGYWDRLYLIPEGGQDDPHGYYDSTLAAYATEGADEVHITCQGSMQIELDYNSNNPPTVPFAGLRLVAYNEAGDLDDGVVVATLATATAETVTGQTIYTIDVDVDETFTIGGKPYIRLELLQYTTALAVQTMLGTDMVYSIIYDPTLDEEVMYGLPIYLQNYPMWLNLPDMTCGEFLKNLMLMFGLFAYCQNGSEIRFTSLSELITNKTQANDWTLRLRELAGVSRKTTLENYAQNNLLKYRADGGVLDGVLDGVIVCDDENLDYEKTLFESAFTLAYNNYVPIWSSNEDGEVEFNGNERVPRIIGTGAGTTPTYVQNMGYQARLAWPQLLAAYYIEYQNVVRQPVVIKAEFLLKTIDLYGMDLRIPIYLKQTGRYYAIRKLTTKSLNVAEAELIEI